MVFQSSDYVRLKYATQEEDEFWEVFNDVMLTVANFIPVNVWWYSRDYRLVGLNQTTVHAIGGDVGNNMIGKTMHDYYSNKIADKFNQVIEQVMTTRIVITEEHKIENHATSQIQYFLDIINPLVNYKDNVMGICGVSFETTDTKYANELRMENEIYKAEKQSQERFRKFIDKLQNYIQNYKIEALNEKLGDAAPIKPEHKIRLTKRESEILYYLSLNKVPKEISRILSILESKNVSPATIQSTITKRLYYKFDVCSISQLIEKANILKLIPSLY